MTQFPQCPSDGSTDIENITSSKVPKYLKKPFYQTSNWEAPSGVTLNNSMPKNKSSTTSLSNPTTSTSSSLSYLAKKS